MFWNVLEKREDGKKKYVKSFETGSDNLEEARNDIAKEVAEEWGEENCSKFSITLTDVSGVEDESFDDIEKELNDIGAIDANI